MTVDFPLFFATGASAYSPLTAPTKGLLRKTAILFHETMEFQAAYGVSHGLPDRYREAWADQQQICPYCDISRIDFAGTREIDHFLPKRYFPLLAVHAHNLIVSCKDCNQSGIKGQRRVGTIDGTAHLVPIFHPFLDNPNSIIRWTFTPDLRSIQLSMRPGRTAPEQQKAQNFNILFKLEDRYAKKLGWLRDLRTYLRDDVLSKMRKKRRRTRAQLEALYDQEIQKHFQRRHPLTGQQEWMKLELDLFEFLANEQRAEELNFLEGELA